MTDLPEGWARASIGVLCDLKNGMAFKPTDWSRTGMKIVRIQNLNKPDAPYNYFEGEIRDRFIINRGDLLFAWSGTPGTSFGAHIWRGERAVLNQHIFRVDFDEASLNKSFFRLAINQKLGELIGKAHGGAGLQHVTKGRFEETVIEVPPLPEQHRIVAKIEALFSELDAGQDSLTRAQAQLRLYRQSLLKAAFQGRLTADWRAANSDKLEPPETLLSRIRTERDARHKQALDDWQHALTDWRAGGEAGRKPAKPSRYEVVGNPDIPEDLRELCGADWPWVRLGDIAEVSGGLTKNPKRNNLARKMKYLRVGNVYADRLDLADISEIGVSDDEWESNSLAQGDLLIVEGNGSVDQIGRVAIWDGSIDHIGHQNHLIRVRLIDGQDARFFLSFLMSPLGRELIVRQASSTSGLHTLSISKVSALPVPVPTSYEQARLLEAVAAPLSLVDHQMGEITTALAKIAALRQSILKQAFSGRLVPQDPADEPATALLARLRDTAPSVRPRRKASV